MRDVLLFAALVFPVFKFGGLLPFLFFFSLEVWFIFSLFWLGLRLYCLLASRFGLTGLGVYSICMYEWFVFKVRR